MILLYCAFFLSGVIYTSGQFWAERGMLRLRLPGPVRCKPHSVWLWSRAERGTLHLHLAIPVRCKPHSVQLWSRAECGTLHLHLAVPVRCKPHSVWLQSMRVLQFIMRRVLSVNAELWSGSVADRWHFGVITTSNLSF